MASAASDASPVNPEAPSVESQAIADAEANTAATVEETGAEGASVADAEATSKSTAGATATTASDSPASDNVGLKKEDDDDDSEHPNSRFECNICLDVAKDAVISVCGHLFCWPCLHTWMETRPQRPVCPVCKAAIDKDKVIPLYGRGGDNKDPREATVPPRPRGQRPEPESLPSLGGLLGPVVGGVSNFQISFGIGAFPFNLLATRLNMSSGMPPAPGPGTSQYDEEQFLNKVFLYVACAFVLWLLVA